MDFAVEIVTGREARARLDDGEFLRHWTRLAALDPKQTLYQEPPFVTTWYRVHAAQFEPLLALGTARPGGEVAALMPLARHLREGRLTHAGDLHAEYKGWIARPEIDATFPVECLLALRRRFPLERWEWGWLPPGTPAGFLDSPRLARHGIFVRTATQAAPLWDLRHPERLELLLKNKAIRNKFNRYAHGGDFRLERVTDKNRTRELLTALAGQCDFRKDIMHHCRPFAENPLKAPFFTERQDFPEANHFTVLWAGDKPVAFHYGVLGGGTLVMGLTAYDPTQGKNSPGLLHLIELAKMLSREGHQTIDLTPGGDAYKEFFANASWPAVTPTFYFSRGGARRADLARAARRGAKKLIRLIGLRPETARRGLNAAARLAGRLKAAPLQDLPWRLARLLFENQTTTIYRLEGVGETGGPLPAETARCEVRVQRYEDLLARDGVSAAARRELLAEAMHRFYAGQSFYSIVIGGELAHHGWLARGGAGRRSGPNGTGVEIPEHAALLGGFQSSPKYNGVNLVRHTVRKMAADLAAEGVREILIAVERGNRPLEVFVREAGLAPVRIQIARRVFMWKKVVNCEL